MVLRALEKDRLTLDEIQTHFLLLLAHQVDRAGADLVWIPAGQGRPCRLLVARIGFGYYFWRMYNH